MSAVVLDLVSRQSVDEAWDALQAHRRRLLDEGAKPLLDRDWVETEARLHRRFTRLLQLMDERS